MNDLQYSLHVVSFVHNCNMATRSTEEDCLLLELNKLKLNQIIKKTTQEPWVCILVFGVAKKDGSTQVVINFCRLHSCILYERFNNFNRFSKFAAVCPFDFASSFGLENAFFFRSSYIPSSYFDIFVWDSFILFVNVSWNL